MPVPQHRKQEASTTRVRSPGTAPDTREGPGEREAAGLVGARWGRTAAGAGDVRQPGGVDSGRKRGAGERKKGTGERKGKSPLRPVRLWPEGLHSKCHLGANPRTWQEMDSSAFPHEFQTGTSRGPATRSLRSRGAGPLPSAGRGDAVPSAATGLCQVREGGGER